jgi:hypothetical protein
VPLCSLLEAIAERFEHLGVVDSAARDALHAVYDGQRRRARVLGVRAKKGSTHAEEV